MYSGLGADLRGVDVFHELADVFNFGVGDGNPLVRSFDHISLEHGFENGKPSIEQFNTYFDIS